MLTDCNNLYNYLAQLPLFSMRQFAVKKSELGTSGNSFLVICNTDSVGTLNSKVTRYQCKVLNNEGLFCFEDKSQCSSPIIRQNLESISHRVAQCCKLANELVYCDENVAIFSYIEGKVAASILPNISQLNELVIPLIKAWHLASLNVGAISKTDTQYSVKLKDAVEQASTFKSVLTEPLNINLLLKNQFNSLIESVDCDVSDSIGIASLDSLGDYLHQQISKLTKFEQAIKPEQYHLCHGDINWHNVIVNSRQQAKLIDFECAVLAPFEYEIAMYLAINSLGESLINEIVDIYHSANSAQIQQTIEFIERLGADAGIYDSIPPNLNSNSNSNSQSDACQVGDFINTDKLTTDIQLDVDLVKHYLPACFLLNGLWYLGQAMRFQGKQKQNELIKCGKEQLSRVGLLTPFSDILDVFN